MTFRHPPLESPPRDSRRRLVMADNTRLDYYSRRVAGREINPGVVSRADEPTDGPAATRSHDGGPLICMIARKTRRIRRDCCRPGQFVRTNFPQSRDRVSALLVPGKEARVKSSASSSLSRCLPYLSLPLSRSLSPSSFFPFSLLRSICPFLCGRRSLGEKGPAAEGGGALN